MPEVSGRVKSVSGATSGSSPVVIALSNAAGATTFVFAPVEWRAIALSAGTLTLVIDAVLVGRWWFGKTIGLKQD
jgi:hypothetical protein